MQSTTAYILSLVIAFVFILFAALSANAIKYQGGSNPSDPRKRKIWFWVLAIINPILNFLLGYFVFKPDGNAMVIEDYKTALFIGTGIGFILYIIIGFVLSKIFKNGKIGNWF